MAAFLQHGTQREPFQTAWFAAYNAPLRRALRAEREPTRKEVHSC